MDATEIRKTAQTRAEDALVRVATAILKSKVEPDGAAKFLKRRPDDEATPALYRAVTTSGSLTQSTWGEQMASQAVQLFVTGLGPMSAAGQLIALSYPATIPLGRSSIGVPGVVPAGVAGAFVKELDPIPVTKWSFDAATLSQKKLAILTVLTRELAKTNGAEAEIRRLLQASAAITLDSVLFSADAATDAAPAGIFNGLTPIIAGGFEVDFSMIDDLTSLVAAVAPVANGRIAFLASPARAAQISMKAPDLRYPVLASAAISDDRIAAVALDAFAVSMNPVPDIDVSQEAVLHMSDDPDELVSDAGAKADPVRSLFATASLAIRLIIDIDWAKRDDRAVAYIENLAW